MYSHIQIENFRSIQSLALEEPGRINLFVGANGSGKTSLL
ncbi:MAG: AAA family ATPase, partial [Dehalococcoidia bacterium]